MPIYEYRCEKCQHVFDEVLSVSNRDNPLSEPCPQCSEKSVKKLVSATRMGVDMNVTPDKKPGGDWSSLMEKVKNNTPERYHGNLDRASSRSGGRLGPQ